MARNNVSLSDGLPERAPGKVMVCLNRPTGISFRLPDGRTVRVNGNAVDLKGRDMGVLPVGAYGLTLLDEDDWQAVKATYGASMPIFAQGLIFAAKEQASALDEARDKAELRNGLEPVSPRHAHTRGVTPDEVM